jgi:hypothetical protein
VLPVNGSEKGIFARIMVGLAAEHGEEKTVMIYVTFLKSHRTAITLTAKKGGAAALSDAPGRHEYQTACRLRQPGTPDRLVRHHPDR